MKTKQNKMRLVLAGRKKQLAKKENREVTRLGLALRGLGSLGGGALGGLIGQAGAGSSIGSNIGASLSKWLGSGDYTVTSNSIINQLNASGNIPSMHKTNQSVVIRHKEFLGEISGSTAFTIQQVYNINPGLATTFPWLASIASKFQEYKILGAVFHYVPTSGTAVSSTSAALGSVMIQTSYRADDNAPLTKQEMLNEYCSTETVPFESAAHPIECDPRENPYNLHYVRSGALTSTHDQLLYDLGTTFVATSGMQSTNVVGDLWVTYEIELKKPVISSEVTDPAQGYALQVVDSAGSITGSALFAGTQFLGGGNLSDRITCIGNVITIAKGLAGYFYIYIHVRANGTYTAVTVPATPTLSGCANALVVRDVTGVNTSLGGGTPTLNRAFLEIAVFKSDTSVPAVITLPAWTLTGTALSTNVTIIQRANPFWT